MFEEWTAFLVMELHAKIIESLCFGVLVAERAVLVSGSDPPIRAQKISREPVPPEMGTRMN